MSGFIDDLGLVRTINSDDELSDDDSDVDLVGAPALEPAPAAVARPAAPMSKASANGRARGSSSLSKAAAAAAQESSDDESGGESQDEAADGDESDDSSDDEDAGAGLEGDESGDDLDEDDDDESDDEDDEDDDEEAGEEDEDDDDEDVPEEMELDIAGELAAAAGPDTSSSSQPERRDVVTSWSFANALAAAAAGEKPTDVVSSLQFKIARRARERLSRGLKLLVDEERDNAAEAARAVQQAELEAEAEAARPGKRPRAGDDVDGTQAKRGRGDGDGADGTVKDTTSAAVASAAAAASYNAAEAAAARAREGAAMRKAAAAALRAGDASSFEELKLSRPLLTSIKRLTWATPTPIQARAIPVAMAGRDVLGSAVTGSGKTAAFLLPCLERLLFRDRSVAATRVLIVLPTRELATQCHEVARRLAAASDIRCALVVGGLSSSVQAAELRTRPDVVIGTPGRLLDHLINSPSVDCDDVDVLVLDEADRLLDMGFTDEVNEIVKLCPPSRQTLLFSATMTKDIEALASLSLRRPVEVSADPLFDMARTLTQEFVRLRPGREDDREPIVLALCLRGFGNGTIVFCKRKYDAHRLALLLGLSGLAVAELHGNLSQKHRLEALEAFREGRAHILVATDVAGRGLDIRGVTTVINSDMPRDLTTYVHRVGRTARAGREGRSITLVGERSRAVMREAVKRAQRNVKSRIIPPAVLERYRQAVESMEQDVKAILMDESVEREARAAETQAQRAQNLVLHADDISSRPARRWVMSERQKTIIRRAEKNAAEEAEAQGHLGGANLGSALTDPSLMPASTPEDEAPRLSVRERKQKKLDEIRAAREAAKLAKEKKMHRMTRAKRRRVVAREDMRKELGEVTKASKRIATNDEDAAAAAKASEARKRLLMASSEGQHAGARKTKREARRAAAELGVAPGRIEKAVSREVTKTVASAKKKKGAAAVEARQRLAGAGGDAVAAATQRFHRAADPSSSAAGAAAMFGDDMSTSRRRAGLMPGRGSAVDMVSNALERRHKAPHAAKGKEGEAKAEGEDGARRKKHGSKPGSHAFKSKTRYRRK